MERSSFRSENALAPTNFIWPTLTFGPSSILKTNFTALVAAMLGQQTFDYHFRALDFCGIELTLHRKPDLLVLERVQDVRFGDRLISLVLNSANDRTFLYVKHDDFSVGLVG